MGTFGMVLVSLPEVVLNIDAAPLAKVHLVVRMLQNCFSVTFHFI